MRILVIEDEKRIATALASGLMGEGFAVDMAFDGEAGFDLAVGESFDLIILDQMLPKLDGLQVAAKLREEQIDTPILMLTAKSQVSDKIAGLESGCDDYLTKPFEFEELLARVRALLRRPKTLLDQVIRVGELEVDSSNFQIKYFGESIPVSQKEFALLEYLARNAKKVVSKNTLIDHVWSFEADILPNTVEVNIKNIRSKLASVAPDHSDPIVTVRGFGYKLG